MVPSWAAGAGASVPLFPAPIKTYLPCAGWYHPLRRSGIMVTRRLSASKGGAIESWCGRRDLNPHGPCGPTDFHTTSAFAAAIRRSWSGLSLRHFRRCPSSLYTFPVRGLARDRHVTGFPEFEQFCIAGFPASTQVSLKSDASADSATPAWHT
jgi:hypothetical protein